MLSSHVNGLHVCRHKPNIKTGPMVGTCVLTLFQSLCRKAKTRFFGCGGEITNVAIKDRHNLFSGDKQNTAAARIHGIISEYPTGSLAAKSNEGTQFLGYTYTGVAAAPSSVVKSVDHGNRYCNPPPPLATSAFARSTGSYGQAAELACGSSEERASFIKAAMAPRGLMRRSARRADRLGGMEVLQERRTPGEAVDYIIITLRQRHSEQTCGGIREKASGRKKLVENTKI
ncbi:unnamed protein product [Gadus morhua 'NCC']